MNIKHSHLPAWRILSENDKEMARNIPEIVTLGLSFFAKSTVAAL